VWVLPSVLGSVLLVGVVLSLGTFNVQNGLSLRQYVQPQHHVYTAIQERIKGKAVLLAPMFVKIWAAKPVYRGMGGWVYEWRRPRPDLQDDVLILRDFRGAYAHLKPKFPKRTFYRVRPLRFPPFMKIFPIKKSK